MTPDRIAINDTKIVHETVDGEVIIINLESGTYYGLRGSALEIWGLIVAGYSGQELVEATAARYGLVPTDVQPGVESFVESLRKEEILSSGAPSKAPVAVENQAPPAAPFAPPAFSKHTNMSDLLLLDPLHDVDEQGWPNERVG